MMHPAPESESPYQKIVDRNQLWNGIFAIAGLLSILVGMIILLALDDQLSNQ
ncbi:MAG: hypothetical protein F6K32_27585, partial [Desertifilum sp. SIO1I2]|nr:hypothetical protein [Desertifilum sp. SIO1I2]